MCGIAGAYSTNGLLPEPERLAAAMQRLLRRGPDDGGVWSDEQVRLGHRRLAVVDLSAAGHQPMVSSDGRYVIVFNGEIYNHRDLRKQLNPPGGWRSTSDTETLIEAYRAWGPRCLDRLNGMFALAIWDRTDRLLFLARDRLGKKPLYYSWLKGVFCFASRPDALTRLLGDERPEADPEALRIYLELGYIPAPLSYYRQVRKLQPAHYLLVDEQGPRQVRYWDYRQIEPDLRLLQRPEAELEEELDALIRDAVRARLMSDVPLGAFLSGGIDSSLVVAAMKSLGVEDIQTFTIAFREQAHDEGPAAKAIASHLGVRHVAETMSVAGLLELLPAFVDEFDEPFADNSAFPTMAVARLARKHVTVALSGDGGDELFGGYHYYPMLDRLSGLLRWPPAMKRMIGNAIALMPSHNAKLLAGALQRQDTVALFQYMRSFSKDFSPLVTPDVLQSTEGALIHFERAAGSFAKGLTSSETGMRLDASFTLPDHYLQKVDVATMSFSLEARCPLIDQAAVEWAMRLPLHYKIRRGETKYLLKKVLSRHLPKELVYRPKKGFSAPVAQWLRGPLKEWASGLINDRSLMSQLPLDQSRVQELFRLHSSGARDAHPLLWSVLMLLCFVSHHVNRQSIPAVAERSVGRFAKHSSPAASVDNVKLV